MLITPKLQNLKENFDEFFEKFIVFSILVTFEANVKQLATIPC